MEVERNTSRFLTERLMNENGKKRAVPLNGQETGIFSTYRIWINFMFTS